MAEAVPEGKINRGLTSRDRLLAVALFLFGALAVLEINDSPLLPGVHIDSVEYVEAGRSLASGRGLAVPLVPWTSSDSVAPLAHFPPGPSLAIGSLIRLTGLPPYVAALWIIALSAGMTLALVFLLVAPLEGWVVGLLSALVVGILPPFVLVHATIWSEPLYLPFLLLTLILMVRLPRRPGFAGVTAAVAAMVRYLGLAAVGSVGIWAFLKTRSLRKALVGIAPGVGVFLAWSAWTRLHGGAVRTWGEFSVPLTNSIAQLPGMVRFWLAPGLPALVATVLLLGVLATHVFGRKELMGPLWVLLGGHLLLTVFSRLVVDHRIPFDARMFLPTIVLAMLPVVAGLWKRRVLGPGILTLWCVWTLGQDVKGVRTTRQVGLYYTDVRWLRSGVLTWLEEGSQGMRIYSNDPGFIAFHLQRNARFLPLKTQDLDEFFRDWTERPGAIVLLMPQQPDEWTSEAYLDNLPVTPAFQGPDALILIPRERSTGSPPDT